MPRPKPTAADMEEREERAKRVRSFMKRFLFSEIRLAETIGVSRRTVQMIKAGKVSPHPDTLRKLNAIMKRHRDNGDKSE